MGGGIYAWGAGVGIMGERADAANGRGHIRVGGWPGLRGRDTKAPSQHGHAGMGPL